MYFAINQKFVLFHEHFHSWFAYVDSNIKTQRSNFNSNLREYTFNKKLRSISYMYANYFPSFSFYKSLEKKTFKNVLMKTYSFLLNHGILHQELFKSYFFS